MESKILYQGETGFVEAVTTLPLTDYENVFVIVYDLKREPLIKACINEIEGEESEFSTDGVNITGDDTFEIIIPSELTGETIPGYYLGEIKTKFSDESLGEFICDIKKENFLFLLLKSELK